MAGIVETRDEVIELMKDLKEHSVSISTIGLYLLPSRFQPISRYVLLKESKARLELN